MKTVSNYIPKMTFFLLWNGQWMLGRWQREADTERVRKKEEGTVGYHWHSEPLPFFLSSKAAIVKSGGDQYTQVCTRTLGQHKSNNSAFPVIAQSLISLWFPCEKWTGLCVCACVCGTRRRSLQMESLQLLLHTQKSENSIEFISFQDLTYLITINIFSWFRSPIFFLVC